MLRKSFLAGLLVAAAAGAAQIPRKSPEFAIQMTPAGQTLLSSSRGKAVCLIFIYTTCPHCQKMTVFLNSIQKEYGPRGLQVMGAAFNPMANMHVPDFNQKFRPAFPVGHTTREAVLEYLQHSPIMQFYVPIMVFIDREGIIRKQAMGDDAFFQDQEKNTRLAIEEMLKPAASTRKAAPVAAKKKTS
ncbi:MAG: TlpA disulfide reductase family protein [Bryobacteraceae bacterium]